MGKYQPDSGGQVLITVLMSVYNTQKKFLVEAIESVLHQTYSDFEFIIVNDCSDEGTTALLREYEKMDERIVLIENGKNLGLTKSLNLGLKQAKGRYIARLDSDDSCNLERLKLQLSYMQSHPGTTVVGCRVHDQYGKRGKIAIMPNEWRKVQLITSNCGLVHSSAFIDAEFLRSNNIFYDETKKRAQDYKLWTDIVANGGIIDIMSDDLVMFRRHKESISVKYREEQVAAALLISCEQLSRLLVGWTDQRLYELIESLDKMREDSLADESGKAGRIQLRQLLVEACVSNKHQQLYDSHILRYELMYFYNKHIGRQEWFSVGYWGYRVVRAMYKYMR